MAIALIDVGPRCSSVRARWLAYFARSPGECALCSAKRKPIIGVDLRIEAQRRIASFDRAGLPGVTAVEMLALSGPVVPLLMTHRLKAADNQHRFTKRGCSVLANSRQFRVAAVKHERTIMKIIVIGGTGLIGSKLVKKLREQGQEIVAASPSSGINSLTGEGLADALKGASVAVDVTNSPSWEDAAVLKFFETSTRNLLKYEAAAGVGHHVALSVVGTERLLESGFFRAKIAQENLIKASVIPYSIVRATQFFEFVEKIADLSTEGNTVRLPPVLFQPMAADDIASALAGIVMGPPVNGAVEIGGPQQFRLDELVRRDLAARNDPREVISDPRAGYYGIAVSERALVPNDDARLGETRFEDWLHLQPSGKRREAKATSSK